MDVPLVEMVEIVGVISLVIGIGRVFNLPQQFELEFPRILFPLSRHHSPFLNHSKWLVGVSGKPGPPHPLCGPIMESLGPGNGLVG